MTVDLTIFYSLNCCICIIFTSCYCVFFIFLHIYLQLRFVICILYNKWVNEWERFFLKHWSNALMLYMTPPARQNPKSTYLRQHQMNLTPWTLVASTKSDAWSASGFLDWSGSECPLDGFTHVEHSFLVSISHFAKFREKRLVTIKNANYLPEMPNSAMVREEEKWSRIRIRDQITTKR